MKPSNMPQKAAPVRTVSRAVGSTPVCDYIRPNGSACMCEGVKHVGVESVLVIRPLGKPNRSVAAALRKAGW